MEGVVKSKNRFPQALENGHAFSHIPTAGPTAVLAHKKRKNNRPRSGEIPESDHPIALRRKVRNEPLFLGRTPALCRAN
jgi:hypothetical protein